MRIVLAILCCMSLGSLGEAGVIELRDRAMVTTGSVVVLGDVAEILDADARRAETLRGLPLGPAPAAGRSLTVTYDDVRQKLQSRGENLAAMEFRGQRQVIVTAAAIKPDPPPRPEPSSKPEPLAKPLKDVSITTPMTPARKRIAPVSEADVRRAETLLAGVLQRAFKPADPGTAVDFECQIVADDAPRVLQCRPEDVHFVAAALRSDAPSTLTAWWFDHTSGERQEIAVTVTLSQRPQRLAVRHAVPKGFLLRAEDLMWVDAEKDDAGLTLLGDAIGQETTRNLRASHPLTAIDVAKVPLMRTNDIVTVVVRRPGISVRREFKALSSAALHETVSLVALNDPRLRIQATVTGYREATMSDTPIESASMENLRIEERPAPQTPRNGSLR